MYNKFMRTSAQKVILFAATFLFVCVGVQFSVPQTAQAASWYNTSWSYRASVTIAHGQVGGALTNLPVYVNLANMPSGFWTHARSDCGDIRVTASDGVTELAREIVSCNNGGQTGELWFNASSLSNSSDTTFYIYYGNPGVSDYATNATYGAQNVWTNGYAAVYHLPNGSTLSANDSTSNANTGSITGATAGTGQLDGAASLSGSSQYITIGNGSSLQITGDMTIQAWVKPTDDANSNGIVGKTNSNIPAPYDFYLVQTTGVPRLWRGNGSTAANFDATAGVSNGVWSFIAVTMSGTSVTHYLNASTNGSGSLSTTIADSGTSARIGSRADSVTMFKGSMDEVQISNVARSASWLLTQYNNQSSPGTFYTMGGETAAPPPTRTIRLFGSLTASAASSITTYLTSGTSYTVPSNWNSSNNTIEAIGGGGGGNSNSLSAGFGGGGGAYAEISNLSLTSGGSVNYQIGAAGDTTGSAGGDTYFNGTGTTCASQSVCAKGGGGGSASGGGGAAGSSIGSITYSGGSGGAIGADGGAGGGGAGGPHGSGGNGAAGSSTTGGGGGGGGGGGSGSGTTGGNNYLGAGGGTTGNPGTNGGGGGGNTTGAAGGAGGAGIDWDASHGAGGGGGASGHDYNAAFPSGGLYGGGGAGKGEDNNGSGGPGAQGIIVVKYTTAAIPIRSIRLIGSLTAAAAKKQIFLTSGTSWTVPSNWNSSNNTIEVIGGGGAGGNPLSGSYAPSAGGGGGYSKSVNLSLTPGGSVTYQIGAGGVHSNTTGAAGGNGGDTWFNSASFPSSGQAVGAKGGQGGQTGATAGTGGAAASGYATGTGNAKFSGGNGGSGGSGGGGGAAGPNGNGGTGGAGGGGSPFGGGGGGGNGAGSAGAAGQSTGTGVGGNNSGGTGGGALNTNGSGGGGGGGSSSTGVAPGTGGAGTEWDASHGSGGGAGAGECTNSTLNGRAGGLYGGAGAGGECGNSSVGGDGAQGIIVITYYLPNRNLIIYPQ